MRFKDVIVLSLGKTALEVAPKLENWLKTWLLDNAEFLEPKVWFYRGHDRNGGKVEDWFDREQDLKGRKVEPSGFWRYAIKHGCMVWTPPPGVGLISLEQLRNARLKRQRSMHAVVIPKLMNPE